MHALLALWLPILLSAAVVFIISSLVHIVFKWHAADYHAFPNEDAVRDVIRAGNPSPGIYAVPYCRDMKDMGSETMQAKYREGPLGQFVLAPAGPPRIGRSLVVWFGFSVIVAAIAAVLAANAYGVDPTRAKAAAWLVGQVSFLAYGFGTITESIWMARPWAVSLRNLLDAALYATGSAFVFYWLWP